jgi:hypothetical protein
MDNEGINTPVTAQTNTQLSKKKVVISFFLIIILLIAIAVILLMPHPSKQSTTPTNTAVQTYRDKDGYFNIQVPNDWTVSEDTAQGTTGIGTSLQATQNIEETQLVGASETGINILVYEGVPTCPFEQPLNTQFAGFPAAYDPVTTTWTIPTNKALVAPSIYYPGNSLIHDDSLRTIPTPIPASVIQQDEIIVKEALKTLKLTNLVPFNC